MRLGLAALFDEFGDLCAGDELDALEREERSAAYSAQRESARRLLRAVQARVVESRALALESELRERERARTIRVGRSEQRALAWRAQAARIESADARAELQRGLDAADADLAALRAEHRAQRAGALEKLGFASPRAWAEALRPGVDLERWSEIARAVLAETESAWHDALAAAGGGISNPVDLERARALPRWSPAFAGMRFEPLDSLTETWRLRVADQAGLEVDDTVRDGAAPEPFLSVARVPDELLLRLPPRAPIANLCAAIALGGRALALGFASDSLPVEQRLLGDPALTLAWGWFFLERFCEPAWLASSPVASRGEAFAAEAQLLVLAPLRSAAARSLTERELASLAPDSDARALEGTHERRMREALGCDWGGESLLRECAPEPRAIDELRAARFAARLAEQLRERHGRSFWRARGCGELLKEIWHTGTTYSLEDLAGQLGLDSLD